MTEKTAAPGPSPGGKGLRQSCRGAQWGHRPETCSVEAQCGGRWGCALGRGGGGISSAGEMEGPVKAAEVGEN